MKRLKPQRPTAEGGLSNEAPEVAFLNANGRESKQPSEETTQGPAEANTAPARPNTNEATTKTAARGHHTGKERERRSHDRPEDPKTTHRRRSRPIAC